MAINPFDDIKDRVDELQARLQGEIATFIGLKARIYEIPQGLQRQQLLNTQSLLESRALALVAEAESLKRTAVAFDPFSWSAYSSIGPSVAKGAKTLASISNLTQEIAAHKAKVSAALSTPPPSNPIPMFQSFAGGGLTSWVIGGALLAGAWWARGRK